jgi:hypothetical protein
MRLSLLVLLAAVACSDPPTTNARPGATLHVVSGNAQATTAGYRLPDTIVVSLRDDNDTPVAFAPIHVSTEAVLAQVTLVDALTRADGTARLVWRLGLTVGQQQLVVTSGADAEVTPLEVVAESRSQPLRALAGDESVLCAIDVIGQLGCWRPLTEIEEAPRWSPSNTTERFVALAVHRLMNGERRGCAAAVSRRVWCFDVTDEGAVNDMTELSGSHAPIVSITTGSGKLERDPPFCGLASDGSAVCWGDNAWGVLGDGTHTSRNTAAPVFGPMRFSQVAVGSYHACATGTDGVGWCWGRNDLSQVGTLASHFPASTPIRRSGILRFETLVPVPGFATCGVVRENSGVYCWGAKEAAGIGPLAMSLIDEPSFPFPAYATGIGRGNIVSTVDDATVVLGTDGASSWWGRLEPGVEQVVAYAARPFLHQLPLGTLNAGHLGGLLCGTARGSTAYLCGRMMTLTGYPSHQLHPEFAGFGMPHP